MRVVVMNKSSVEDYAMSQHDNTSVVISIASRGSNKAFIVPCTVNNIKDVLFLNFNDTLDTNSIYGGIERKEAEQISEFVKKYSDEVDTIIVQCEAGQSRSAGTAAAIMKYLFNDDSEIFDNRNCTPNILCYMMVLGALLGRGPYDLPL